MNLKLALAYGMIFNEMLRHTDFLTMSAHTMGVSTLDFNRTAAALNTRDSCSRCTAINLLASIPVALHGNSPQPAPKYPVGGDQPKTNSGSPTYPLDMFAALTPDRKFLTLAVVNATESEQKFDLNVSGCGWRAIDAVADDRERPGRCQPRWPGAAGRGERDRDRRRPADGLGCADQRQHLSFPVVQAPQ